MHIWYLRLFAFNNPESIASQLQAEWINWIANGDLVSLIADSSH